jgi:hypothetical protein
MFTKVPLRLVLPAAVVAAAMMLTPVALAAKGGAGGGSHGSGSTTSAGGSIGLILLSSTDGLPHFGQKVTFDVSTTATTKPWVTVDCSQNGVAVYHASNGIFPTSLGQVFTLASNSWTSGEADCTAWLQNWDNYAKHGTIQDLAAMSFHVYA